MSKFNSETSFLYQLFKENSNFIVSRYARLYFCLFFIIFIIIYVYSYVYLCIYTPSYQHLKAFPVSNINSETTFLYQLFKENLNFIVTEPCKVICNSFFLWFSLLFIFIHLFINVFLYIYTPSNQHFNAFLVSKFNSETSFLYQLFKENLNFIVWKPCNVLL